MAPQALPPRGVVPQLAPADGRTPQAGRRARIAAAVLALGGALLAAPAQAERADRSKPITLDSDKPCTVNLAKQISQCSGDVVVTQGSLQLRAEKLEVRDTAEGYPQLMAEGQGGAPARVRQRRDGLDETVEGQAQRIHYDSRAGVLRFEGQALVRRMRGSQVADEVQGALVVWDGSTETFSVQGGQPSAANPSGRVRAVIVPRAAAEAEGRK